MSTASDEEWTDEDYRAAAQEGWWLHPNIFIFEYAHSDTTRFHAASPSPFKSDEEARQWVQANATTPLRQKALRLAVLRKLRV